MAKDEQIDKGSKEFELEMLKILSQVDLRQIFEEEYIKNVQYGVMFTSKDLKLIIRGQNLFKQQMN